MSKWLALAQAALVGIFFAGCSPKVEEPRTEALEQTYEIDPEAGLSIRNIDGSIVIHGTETASLKLRTIKKASSGEEFKGINVTAIAEGKSVSISTKFISQKNKALSSGSRTVDYTIELPRTVNLTRVDLDNGNVLIDGIRAEDLHASVVDGQLAVRNCCGNAHVSVANGVLDLYYEACDRRRFQVDAQMTNGKAGVFIGPGASFHIQAETMAGKIINELGDIVNLNGQSTRRVDISTGNDAVRHDIKLRVTTGNIKIADLAAETGPDSRPGQ
jgi:DUF4097 and DUF4098 domain-containing protein YvlB